MLPQAVRDGFNILFSAALYARIAGGAHVVHFCVRITQQENNTLLKDWGPRRPVSVSIAVDELQYLSCLLQCTGQIYHLKSDKKEHVHAVCFISCNFKTSQQRSLSCIITCEVNVQCT